MHTIHQTTNSPQNHNISPDTNLHTTYTNIKHIIFGELVPLVLALLKKHIRVGQAGIMDHSVDLSIPDFLKSIEKEWTEAKKKKKKSFTTNHNISTAELKYFTPTPTACMPECCRPVEQLRQSHHAKG